MTDLSNEELKKQLKELQHQFNAWKQLHEPEIFIDDYKTLAYQQMDCIMSLRKRLEERDRQCADLFREIKSLRLTKN
jgi:hypothetical protein